MQTGISSLRQRACAPAVTVSLSAHALLIFSLFHPLLHNDGRLGRRAGAVTAERRLDVFLTAAEADVERRAETAPAPLPQKTAHIASRPHPHVLPPPAASTSAATSEVATPGSHFVSPFAPILSSPMGRAGWGAPPVYQQQAQYQREQAHAQYRAALMERLAIWVGQQVQRQQEANCTLRVGLDSRQAAVSCQPAGAEAPLWAALNGLVVAGTSGKAESVCLRAGMAQLGFVPCEEQTTTSDPPIH